MGNDALTLILTIALMASFVILMVLIFVFTVIVSKNKKQQKELEKKANFGSEQSKDVNISTTKTYSIRNVKDFLEFEDIKDNMIVQSKGKRYVMVIKCEGVNYDLMSAMERISVEQGFIEFLNTINRPIQLYIQTRKVNLEESILNYNEKLKDIESEYRRIKFQYEQAKMQFGLTSEIVKKLKYEYVRQGNLLEYTRDIIENTNKMSLNKNILTKNYYIAISHMPENSDGLYGREEIIDMAFSELYTNAQTLVRAIAATGVKARVLNSTELADLLYVAYNRDSSEVMGVDKAIKAGYDALYVTAPDVLDKKIIELDRIVEEKATQLANDTILKVSYSKSTYKERILEEKEENLEENINKRAKEIIKENKEYVTEKVANEVLKELGEEPKVENTYKPMRYTMKRKVSK